MIMHTCVKTSFILLTILLFAGSAAAVAGEGGLHSAAREGDLGALERALGQGAGVNSRDDEGHTPLHAAAAAGREDAMLLLLDHGARVNARSDTGATPLHLAAAGGWSGAVDLLVERGALVDARDDEGLTPLQHAEANGRQRAAERLAAAGSGTPATRPAPAEIPDEEIDPFEDAEDVAEASAPGAEGDEPEKKKRDNAITRWFKEGMEEDEETDPWEEPGDDE